jgi:hypothetical protein
MIIGIVCLIIGIVGFVKGRINVTKTKELRGGPMYLAATLFCLPLPLGIVVGLFMGVSAAAQGQHITATDSSVLIAGLLTTWVPILLGIIIGFVAAKPKLPPAPPAGPPGFEVKM